VPDVLAGAGDLAARTWVALVHHPVLNRSGEVIATAVTNLDIHDIARAARTYGLAGYLVVTPVERQRHLVERILAHWKGSHGRGANRNRADALSRVRVVPDVEAGLALVSRAHGAEPVVVATAARESAGTVSGVELLRRLGPDPRPVVILFGTGWGLADPVLERASLRLDPLKGPTDYNHLSVRSAVCIVLDRLFGLRELPR